MTSNLGLGFDQAVKAGSGFIRIYKSDGTLFHTIAITDTSQVTFSTAQPARVTINPSVDLVAGTGYYILVDAGAIENAGGEDYAGISSATTLNFTTAGSPPGDTVAPLLNTTTPADNATGVAAGSNLVLTFNEAVKAGSGNIEIHKISDGTIAKTIAITDTTQATFSGTQLTINPTTDLDAGTGYYVTFASGVVRDLANNNFAGISASTAFNFTTSSADSIAPTLVGTTPVDNATLVSALANLNLSFSETVTAGSGNIEIRKVSDGSIAWTIAVTDTSQVTFDFSEVTINPAGSFTYGGSYYVTFGSGVMRDLAGNPFAGISSPTTFNFTVEPSDLTGPVLIATSPSDNTTDVDVGADIVMTFNEDIKVGSGSIYICYSNGVYAQVIDITDASQVTFSGNQLIIDPGSDLQEGKGYFLNWGANIVLDMAGNALYGYPTNFHFSTDDLTPPQLISTSPVDGATEVNVGANLALTFSEAVQAGSGNIEIRRASDGSVVKSIAITDASQVSFDTNQITINPTTNLAQGVSYYVTLNTGVVLDLGGNAFTGISSPTVFNFSTPPFALNGTETGETLNGSANNDLINGLAVLDTLIGGLGDDTYIIQNREGGATSLALRFAPTQFDPDGYAISFADDAYVEIYVSDDTHDGAIDYLNVGFLDANHSYGVIFATTAMGTNLLPGTYLNAEDPYGTTPGHPGLYYAGDGQAAGQLTGSFTITAIEFDYSGATPVLVRASITFDAQADGRPDLHGTFNYNYTAAGSATYDTVVESPNGGSDTVEAWISYGLRDNVENLTLIGFDDIDGWGNELVNVITGNNGDNILDGAGGADTLVGSYGNDTFTITVGAGNDVIVDFAAGAGSSDDVANLDGFALNTFNAVQAAMSQDGANTVLNLGGAQTLTFLNHAPSDFVAGDFTFLDLPGPPSPPPPPSGPEPFTLPVSGAFTNTISGTRRVDSLTGNGGNNRLDGKQGNDTMSGLGGDDTYLVDASGDVVVESSGQGIDTVISSASSTLLANNVENLTLSGTNNHTATGNGLNNLIVASNRPDTINGGAGNDIIRAGTGACVLTGGTGNDIFDFDVMGSQKTVTDFHVGEDLVDLRTLLSWYGGSNPVGDNVLAVTATAGGVLIAVKATAGGSLQNLVKLTGISVGDVDVGGDILWDA